MPIYVWGGVASWDALLLLAGLWLTWSSPDVSSLFHRFHDVPCNLDLCPPSCLTTVQNVCRCACLCVKLKNDEHVDFVISLLCWATESSKIRRLQEALTSVRCNAIAIFYWFVCHISCNTLNLKSKKLSNWIQSTCCPPLPWKEMERAIPPFQPWHNLSSESRRLRRE